MPWSRAHRQDHLLLAVNLPNGKLKGRNLNVGFAKIENNDLVRTFRKEIPRAARRCTQLNAALLAILADYEEIRTWLAAEDSSVPRDPGELEQAHALARDLEIEILSRLEKQG